MKGIPCVESATARSTRCQFCNLGKRNCSQAHYSFPDNPRRLWRSIKKGGRFGLEAPVDEPPTSDSTSGHSNYVSNNGIIPAVPEPTLEDPFTPKEIPLECPQRSPTRPSTLASTSNSIQPPVARTSRDPMSPEAESIFETRHRLIITGNFTDQKKVNKKVVTSLSSEVDSLTEVFVDKAIKSAIPGEPTIALIKEAVAYVDGMVVKFREDLKKF
ncbi:hypothetical protein O181_102197 [Austropuccinia psidii MF-1]|uniref:Uncharacterized protein n=1 Tax=Austropuccinia psidii MF-1 TaxID=1389203 RepID=A0A9Q3JHE6_9BASI|nr:hypothetical protein [Austropuccinia psidii MF-1]